MKYTWKEEMELEQELDPNINPYTGKLFEPRPEGYWQDMLRRYCPNDPLVRELDANKLAKKQAGDSGTATPVNQAVEPIRSEPLMPSKSDETLQYPEGEKTYKMPTDVNAVRIGILWRKSRASMADSVRYAIEAGHLLTAKKDSLEHGEWLPWLEANADTLGFNNRSTASRLMKLAKQHGSPDGAPAHHLNEADVLQINRQIWATTKHGRRQLENQRLGRSHHRRPRSISIYPSYQSMIGNG
jgi:hypothetical protein